MCESIGKLNAAIYRNIQGIFNNKLEDTKIHSGQSEFFYLISLNEGITQKEISERLFVNKSTTAKAIKNLVKNEYVFKEKDGEDKRFDRLYLTNEGKKISGKVRETFLEVLDISTRNLSEEETDMAIILLKKILENVSMENRKLNGEEIK